MKAICSAVHKNIRDANSMLFTLAGMMQVGSAQVVSEVANVSLREVRLWCQLNTKQVADQIRAADSVEALEAITAGTMLDIISAGAIPVPYKLKGAKNDRRPQYPWVYFLCTGGLHGEKPHQHVNVGSTKERFGWWEQLQRQRDAARDSLIGGAARTAWGQWVRRLISLDGGKSEKAKHEMRERIMLGKLLPEEAVQVRDMLENPLRNCKAHHGQACSQEGLEQAQCNWVLPCVQDCLGVFRSRCRGFGHKANRCPTPRRGDKAPPPKEGGDTVGEVGGGGQPPDS
ncbi:hypothetical protein G6O67_006697 [Ophiocordyceps sinensis]|uniref:Uncharacterized protein n=1 Tax=Ophiocordyceps sinensis TaxID=72228 RepID=A0A8H4PL09_9HYPO|nr:hypothetical protein G6O67_006697 [Ophiocordyceps sinensis]